MKNEIRINLESAGAQEIARWAVTEFDRRVALACSFSLEDIVVAHMMVSVRPDVRIFSLDTGRLNEETYACAEEIRRRLGIAIEWYFPDRAAVEALEREKGLYSFRTGLDARLECCRIRKVEPLARALSGLRAWITGLRREQSVTRAQIRKVEEDEAHPGLIKINPLVDWKVGEVRRYIRENNLPHNRLYDAGYTSIGCEPCTRAVRPGEDPRSGRWWWESPEHKECGLHARAAPPASDDPGRTA